MYKINKCVTHQNITLPELRRGMRWRSCFRHCAATLKVTGSIPKCVIDIFLWHNPWPWCRLSGCLGPTILPSSCADCLDIWEPQLPGTFWTCNWSVRGLICLIKKESSIKIRFRTSQRTRFVLLYKPGGNCLAYYKFISNTYFGIEVIKGVSLFSK